MIDSPYLTGLPADPRDETYQEQIEDIAYAIRSGDIDPSCLARAHYTVQADVHDAIRRQNRIAATFT